MLLTMLIALSIYTFLYKTDQEIINTSIILKKKFKNLKFKFKNIKIQKLYENIIHKNLQLINNSSLQTYLNSICLNQLRSVENKELDINGNIKTKKKPLDDEDKKNYNEKIEKDEILSLRNSNDGPINPDWLPNVISEDQEYANEIQKNAVKTALRKMKHDGGHCAELLVLFWWRKRSMKELTEIYGYKNELTTKNQKARCQKRLKIIMQKEI